MKGEQAFSGDCGVREDFMIKGIAYTRLGIE
jgi:hypothetical protein